MHIVCTTLQGGRRSCTGLCKIALAGVLAAVLACACTTRADEATDTAATSTKPVKRVDPLSVVSLYLEAQLGGTQVTQATGFVVKERDLHFLVTNWHVVTLRDPETGKPVLKHGSTGRPIADPDSLRIWHHGKQLGTWVTRVEPLREPDGSPRWIEHKEGRSVDVVAVPLQNIDEHVQVYPLDRGLADIDMALDVAMPISIIGFPAGFTGPHRFPIWKTGHIASDPELDYDGRPMFLIDATTRGGMSGSPVMLRSWAFRNQAGTTVFTQGMRTRLLGVYSGRLGGSKTEIGKVWRAAVLEEIVARAVQERSHARP